MLYTFKSLLRKVSFFTDIWTILLEKENLYSCEDVTWGFNDDSETFTLYRTDIEIKSCVINQQTRCDEE